MTYRVSIFGKTYELPARTLAVDEKIEGIASTDREYQAGGISRREAVERLHTFVEALVPGAPPAVDEVDTNELISACLDIISAYDAPAKKARAEASLASVRELMKNQDVKRLIDAAVAMNKQK